MSFGRRTTMPGGGIPPADRAAGRTRRGGYPLGVLAVAVAGFAGMAVASLIPFLNPTGASVLDILGIAAMAVVNITVVAAILMLPVDLLLRTLNWRRPWIYALFCGLILYILCFALGSIGGRLNPLFLVGIALWPGAAGGWVMGLFRR